MVLKIQIIICIVRAIGIGHYHLILWLKTAIPIYFMSKRIGHLTCNYGGYTKGAIAPVINLSAEYVSTMIGDGTIGNEYRVE